MVTEEINGITAAMAWAYLTPEIGAVLDLLLTLDPPWVSEALETLSDVEVRALIERSVEKWWQA
jgi:hypothetical protein